MTAAARSCTRCNQPLSDALFCQFCGTYVLDTEATVVMATRAERILAWLINALIFVFTLFIGWLIWWFIVAPRGQNPGKAVVGIRVIRTNGDAVKTGGMFVRGIVAQITGLIPFFLDDLWMFWDRNAQTIHDKVVDTVVVKARGSEKIVEKGGLEEKLEPVKPYPSYAPPISLPTSSPATQPPEDPEQALARLADLRERGVITEEEYLGKRRAVIDKL